MRFQKGCRNPSSNARIGLQCFIYRLWKSTLNTLLPQIPFLCITLACDRDTRGVWYLPQLIVPHAPKGIFGMHGLATRPKTAKQAGEFPVDNVIGDESRLATDAASDCPQRQQGLVRRPLAVCVPYPQQTEAPRQDVRTDDSGSRHSPFTDPLQVSNSAPAQRRTDQSAEAILRNLNPAADRSSPSS